MIHMKRVAAVLLALLALCWGCAFAEGAVSTSVIMRVSRLTQDAIVNEGDTRVSHMANEVIEVPATKECLEPLLAIIPLQLLAYHIAVCKGKDVDQPRNLAKSVTVE